LKILYLHQYFNSLQDAGSTRSYEMARRLVQKGHEVHLITSDRTPSANKSRFKWRVTTVSGIHVHWASISYSNQMGFNRRLWAFCEFSFRAALKAASMKCDLIFASSTPLTIAIPGIYASRRRGVPMVLEVRDLWPELPIAVGALKSSGAVLAARRLELLAYENADRIVALSPGMKDGIRKTGYPDTRIHVIPNSADIDLFSVPAEAGNVFRQRYNWLQERPLVIYTGTIGLINGLQYLVHLAAIVRRYSPEVRFLVVGDGREKGNVLQSARNTGILGKNFFLLDSLPKKEMPSLLSAADLATSLFIDLPAMWANSANKFFDALASSTPIAINYGGWQADLLRQTGAGLVLSCNATEDDAHKVLTALYDLENLRDSGKRARKLAETSFSRDKLASELEKALIMSLDDR
jgi:glycosyltransferase involved in cell wall biosynthesis